MVMTCRIATTAIQTDFFSFNQLGTMVTKETSQEESMTHIWTFLSRDLILVTKPASRLSYGASQAIFEQV